MKEKEDKNRGKSDNIVNFIINTVDNLPKVNKSNAVKQLIENYRLRANGSGKMAKVERIELSNKFSKAILFAWGI